MERNIVSSDAMITRRGWERTRWHDIRETKGISTGIHRKREIERIKTILYRESQSKTESHQEVRCFLFVINFFQSTWPEGSQDKGFLGKKTNKNFIEEDKWLQLRRRRSKIHDEMKKSRTVFFPRELHSVKVSSFLLYFFLENSFFWQICSETNGHRLTINCDFHFCTRSCSLEIPMEIFCLMNCTGF